MYRSNGRDLFAVPSSTALLGCLRTWAASGGPGVHWWARLATAVLYAIGLGFLFFFDPPTFHDPPVALMLLRTACFLVLARRIWIAWLGWLFAGLVALTYFGAFYLSLIMGAAMGWQVPLGTCLVVALLLIASLLGPRWTGGVRVPLMLALGIWVWGCGRLGWYDGEFYAYCDDYALIRKPVEIVVPTVRDFASCHSGQRFFHRRFPRYVWDSPNEDWFLFTTQGGTGWHEMPDGPVAANETLTGLICEAEAKGSHAPRCFGGLTGMTQPIADVSRRDQVVVGEWKIPSQRPLSNSARIWSFSRQLPTQETKKHDLLQSDLGAEFLYEPTDDSLWLFSEGFENARVKASDYSPLPPSSLKVYPFQIDYDPSRNEGIICGMVDVPGEGFANVVAFHGTPPTGRQFTSFSKHPFLMLGLARGCAFDATTRKAFVLYPTLGLMARFDYDSGRLEKIHPAGSGLRSVVADGRRGRIYAADFFGRDVIAFDVDSLREVQRWTVGRFARQVRMSRDRQFLLVGTSLGIVRVRLDNGPDSFHDPQKLTLLR